MALVGYSDSEESDAEPTTSLQTLKSVPNASKLSFQKVIDSSQPGSRKIRVELPSLKPETQQVKQSEEPLAKRPRTGGAFSGFNSFLPAPKGRAQANKLKPGVTLRTSSEAVFSRLPIGGQVPKRENSYAEEHDIAREGSPSYGKEPQSSEINSGRGNGQSEEDTNRAVEPKLVGKTTRFVPLSVATKKKKKPKPKLPTTQESQSTQNGKADPTMRLETIKDQEPVQKPKRSLFHFGENEAIDEAEPAPNSYKPVFENTTRSEESLRAAQMKDSGNVAIPANSLEAVAIDLDLTPTQKRQLFGRNKGNDIVNIQTFNTEAEYAVNERLRQAGEVVEHRAVKAIAPGKHSLQQLVTNAKSQQDAMEDKWASGKRERGEAGSKYGWGS